MDKKKLKIMLIAIYNQSMLFIYEEIGISMIAAYLREKDDIDVCVMGKSEKDIDYEWITGWQPDLIGFTVYDSNRSQVNQVSKRIRSSLPDTLLFLGGNEATFQSEDLLNTMQQIDFVIRGEGEKTCLEVVRCLKDGTSPYNTMGLSYRRKGVVVHNNDQVLIADLDTIPFMSRDILVQNRLNIAQISTSRGCTGNCSFCAAKIFWKKWRGRSINNVLDEIEHVANTYGIDTFYFTDGSFEDPDSRCERIASIAQGIIDRKLNVYYMALFRADFCRKATPELMRLLTKSGLFTAFVGVESANEPDLRLYGKRARLSDCMDVINLFKPYNIGLQIGFIVYNPYSTRDSMIANIDYMQKNRYLNRFASLNPYRGTELYNKLQRDGLLNECMPNGYSFVDQDTGARIEYINNYLNSHQNLLSAYTKLDRMKNYTVFVYPNVFRRAKRKNDNDSVLRITEIIELNNRYIGSANDMIGTWLITLMKMPPEQWQSRDVDRYSHEYWSNNDINSVLDENEKQNNLFSIELSRKNTAYISAMLSFFVPGKGV